MEGNEIGPKRKLVESKIACTYIFLYFGSSHKVLQSLQIRKI